MEKFVTELCRIEVDDNSHMFNGMYSAEEYTKYLYDLFTSANLNNIADEKIVKIIKVQIHDFMTALDAYLPMYQETLENMRRDAQNNPLLNKELDWYCTLYNIRCIKEYYYKKILSLLDSNCALDKIPSPEYDKPIDNLARGVKNIGAVLGCGTTKAQEILNTHFLEKNNVGYYIGKTPILEKDKWNSLSSDKKEQILNNKKKNKHS